jgi:hypothetical protein
VRGFAQGRLEAFEQGVYEDWGQEEHPNFALLQDRLEFNQLCRTILAEFFEEPQCLHSALTVRIVHFFLFAPSSKTVSSACFMQPALLIPV